jgi:hypothetical protein
MDWLMPLLATLGVILLLAEDGAAVMRAVRAQADLVEAEKAAVVARMRQRSSSSTRQRFRQQGRSLRRQVVAGRRLRLSLRPSLSRLRGS